MSVKRLSSLFTEPSKNEKGCPGPSATVSGIALFSAIIGCIQSMNDKMTGLSSLRICK